MTTQPQPHRAAVRGSRAKGGSVAERLQSAAVMHSVRLASGRRRAARPELDPRWAALERKLLL